MTSSGMNHPSTWNEQGLLPGFTLPIERRADLHKVLGRDLPRDAYRLHLTGHRILVAPEPVSEQTEGGLWKARSTTERQKLMMGAGWIVAVGPLAGKVGDLGPTQPHPVGVLAEHPTRLLGAHILFKAYTGVAIQVTDKDDEWEGELWTMTDRDIIAVTTHDGV